MFLEPHLWLPNNTLARQIMNEPIERRRALISVTNKRGLDKFEALTDIGRWEIISTGGTARELEKYGIPHTPIEEVTGLPEMMGGRLKTLHHKIHGGILPDRSNVEHMEAAWEHSMKMIDLVVCNLYDFAGNPSIEQIDIGGPTLLRAAAKNWPHVWAVCSPGDYESVIDELLSPRGAEEAAGFRQALAAAVFRYTGQYDTAIGQWMDYPKNANRMLEEARVAWEYSHNFHYSGNYKR